jgi:hypothetical protein
VDGERKLCNSCCWYLYDNDDTCLKYPWEKAGMVVHCSGYAKLETKCAQCDNPAAPEDTLCKSCSDKVDLVCDLNDGYVKTDE